MNVRRELDVRISKALAAAGAPEGAPALVAQAAKPRFGDYQANGVMAAAKKLKTSPRDLAEKVVAAADLSDMAEKPEVAGAGFINITLKSRYLTDQLHKAIADERLGVEIPAKPQTVVVDYSSPNLAKEMHVGHLRSTIIGDAIARVLEFLVHDVKRQNHVGDWGTQFGMLIAYLKQLLLLDPTEGHADSQLSDLEDFYRKAKERFDAEPAFADASRQEVVNLQSGDSQTCDMWDRHRELSLRHCEEVYKRLGVLLTRQDVSGESAYNDQLADVAEELDKKSLLKESQGAQCVFLDEFRNKDGEILPVIVQKSDGGYLYATTDLAALRHRSRELKADRILYVTDSRQAMHFRQIFAVARKAGFVGENVSLEHVAFGMMLGENRQPLKTRAGGTVKLMDLLDEAEKRALEIVREKNPDLADQQKADIARAVGIGAVKYADLAQNRTSDYVFSWDKMLSLEGNTAPYMQYAYARIRSIFRKGEEQAGATAGEILLAEPAERTLGVKLAQFPETIQTVADECLSNVLCAYLFDLAGAFMSFYESCPVLIAAEPARTSRLILCDLTARTIQTGLGLLGIETIEQM